MTDLYKVFGGLMLPSLEFDDDTDGVARDATGNWHPFEECRASIEPFDGVSFLDKVCRDHSQRIKEVRRFVQASPPTPQAKPE